SQFVLTPLPSGVISPIPVTTTLLITTPSSGPYKSLLAARFDKIDGILHGEDLLGRVIRDFAAKFFLECHHQLDRVETVGAQIIDKACILGYFRFVDPEVLDDNLLHALGDIAHIPKTSKAFLLLHNSGLETRSSAGSLE